MSDVLKPKIERAIRDDLANDRGLSTTFGLALLAEVDRLRTTLDPYHDQRVGDVWKHPDEKEDGPLTVVDVVEYRYLVMTWDEKSGVRFEDCAIEDLEHNGYLRSRPDDQKEGTP